MVLESSGDHHNTLNRFSRPSDSANQLGQTQAEAALAASESRYQDMAAKLSLLVERTPIAVVDWV